MRRPVLELVRERFSCRSYLSRPIDDAARSRLRDLLEGLGQGPFGSPIRLTLVAAAGEDARALKGLGTYGTIRNPQGFIVGVAGPGPMSLEDFGHVMERAVLEATDIGLGTCWLGGFFRKSRFVARIGLAAGETIPAVVALGYCADEARSGGLFGLISRRSSRQPAAALFFSGTFERALPAAEAGRLSPAIESVRLAPSASNKQPWRVLRQEDRWHFFLRRTKGYATNPLRMLHGDADLQRVDLGIAMCHFELAARETGTEGAWGLADPGIDLPDGLTRYVATWRERARGAPGSV